MPIGSSRTRIPVAWKTALAIAADTPTALSSPMPLAPIGLACSSHVVDELHVDLADVGVAGDDVAGEVLGQEPARGSARTPSAPAVPARCPQTIPPVSWLRAASGLMMRPARVHSRRTGSRRTSPSSRVDPHLDEHARRRCASTAASRSAPSAPRPRGLSSPAAPSRSAGLASVAAVEQRSAVQLAGELGGRRVHGGADAHGRRRAGRHPGRRQAGVAVADLHRVRRDAQHVGGDDR